MRQCSPLLEILIVLVILACPAFPAGAQPPQPPGTIISLPPVSTWGVFDPSEADTAPGQRAWMSYSAVDPSPTWPAKRIVTTRLAYSDDMGATWTDMGTRVNDISEIPGLKARTWFSEVSSLVFDPYAPPQEQWKLFWHHYLAVNEVGQNQNSWIGYKSADSPQALAGAKEIKLFGALGYDAVNDDPQSKTHPPVGGPPVVEIYNLHHSDRTCVALTEPGAMATQSGLYISLVCYVPRVQHFIGLLGMGLFGQKGHVITLKCDNPCNPVSPAAWRYVSTMLTDKDAKSVGYKEYSAPDLFSQDGSAYLMVSPTSDEPGEGSYNGCDIYRFSSLETGTLEKDDRGKPRIIGKVQGNPNTFNGACTYRTAVAASGFLYSELKLKRRPFFQIFQTGPYPILPGE